MPEPFELGRLSIPEASPYHELLGRCPGAMLRRYADEELLVSEGDDTREVFLVLQGACVVESVSREGASRRSQTLAIITATLDAPAFVGEMAYLGGGFRTANVRCSGAVFALVLPPASLELVIDKMPFFTRILCRQFAGRLREATQLLKDHQRECMLDAGLVVKQPGDVIFRAGDPAETLYQLVEGTVLLESADGARRVTAADLLDGFIEPGPFFRDGERESTVTAQTTAMLVSISKGSMRAVIRRYPDLLLDVYRGR